jgi:hypothetical protein
MSDEHGFWMIYVNDSNFRHIQYTNKEDVQKEAERLAIVTGKTAYILFAIEGYKTADRPVVNFQTVAF